MNVDGALPIRSRRLTFFYTDAACRGLLPCSCQPDANAQQQFTSLRQRRQANSNAGSLYDQKVMIRFICID